MTVVAAFTAVPATGLIPPSEEVQFTDQSTGNPDSWLWDFGDGDISEEQHPVHTFIGNIGDTFGVTLKAWITASSLSVSMTLVAGIRFEKSSGFVEGTPEAALAALPSTYILTNQSSGPTRIIHQRGPGEQYHYQRNRETRQLSMPSGPSGGGTSVFKIEYSLGTGPSVGEATVTSDIGGAAYGGSARSTWLPFLDVTGYLGASPVIIFEPAIVAISTPVPLTRNGIEVSFRAMEYTTGSSSDYDEEVGIVAFGTSPVAAFTGAPTAGPSPLTVQFENQSTPAVGLPTTYSWKKRISGSGDAFVEFSTAENPSHIFTK